MELFEWKYKSIFLQTLVVGMNKCWPKTKDNDDN